MLEELTIQPFQNKYLNKLKILHQETFKTAGFNPEVEIKNIFNEENCLIAIINNELIGFSIVQKIFDYDYIFKDINTKLNYLANPQYRDFLIEYFQEEALRLKKGKAIVEFFDNEFAKSAKIDENDSYISDIENYEKPTILTN